MRWICKVAAFKFLGAIPAGEHVHFFIQKRITQSLKVTNGMVLQKIQVGTEYLDFLEEVLGARDVSSITHVDIGAGWMPTIPLLLYSVGFDRQLLLDIRRNMDIKLVSDVVCTFRQVVSKEKSLENRCKRLPPLVEPTDTLESYLTRVGIRYVGPYRADDLLNERGFKFITCTQVLLHLNKDQLRSLFQAIAAALKDGGVFVAPVHLHDIYSDFDKSLSPYNKWRYSEFVWENVINSKMMSFNRLTASEYRQVLEESGLKIISFRVAEPTMLDFEQFKRIKIHKQFSYVPERELASKYLFLAAKHGDTHGNFPCVS
jgi:hypothetical protein